MMILFMLLVLRVDIDGKGPYINTGIDGDGNSIGTNLVNSDEILYIETFDAGLGADDNFTSNNNVVTNGVRLFLTCITEEPIYKI